MKECTYTPYEEEAGSAGILDVDLDNEESIRSYARVTKARNLGAGIIQVSKFRLMKKMMPPRHITFSSIPAHVNLQRTSSVYVSSLVTRSSQCMVYHTALQSLELIPPSSPIMSI